MQTWIHMISMACLDLELELKSYNYMTLNTRFSMYTKLQTWFHLISMTCLDIERKLKSQLRHDMLSAAFPSSYPCSISVNASYRTCLAC